MVIESLMNLIGAAPEAGYTVHSKQRLWEYPAVFYSDAINSNDGDEPTVRSAGENVLAHPDDVLISHEVTGQSIV